MPPTLTISELHQMEANLEAQLAWVRRLIQQRHPKKATGKTAKILAKRRAKLLKKVSHD